MARISVEQTALTDPRFKLLGMELGAQSEDCAQAYGLYYAMQVWNYCQERSVYEVSRVVLDAIRSGLADALVWSDLATKITTEKRDSYRIHGTKGRIEWVKKLRVSNKLRQRSHRQRNALVTRDNPGALTLTPTPTPTQKELIPNTSIQPSAELDPLSGRRVKPRKKPEPDEETMRFFLAFYGDYPRHEGRMEALRAFVKLNPDKDLLRTISRDIQTRINSGKWQPDIPEQLKFIPLPASYLNGRRWEDGQFA